MFYQIYFVPPHVPHPTSSKGQGTRLQTTIPTDHATLKLSCSDSMSFDVDDVIDPSCDLIISIPIPQRSIPSKVESRVRTKVGVEELFVVSIDGPCHSWPWLPDAQVTTNTRTNKFFTLNLTEQ